MNKVFISGRLVRDPESRVTTNGKSLCTFSIANNMRYGNNKKTGFYSVTAWGNSANIITKHCAKGHQIFITGRLDHNRWEDQKGNMRSDVNIVLEHFDFGQKPIGEKPGSIGIS